MSRAVTYLPSVDFVVDDVRSGVWPEVPPDSILLRLLDWNDWFQWRTAFYMHYFDDAGNRHEIGEVKIAKLDHEYRNEPSFATPLAKQFKRLGDMYVSVGMDEDYYLRLRRLLGAPRSQRVLAALHDLAADIPRFERVRAKEVVAQSLMRGVAAATIKNKFARIILTGDDSNVEFDFTYTRPAETVFPLPPTKLEFAVRPDSRPPTNVHVLIGRNGSGKTTLLRSMARAMLGRGLGDERDGVFETPAGGVLDVANLVYVSFSAFDEASLPVLDKQLQWAVPYSYVGLQYIPALQEEPQGPELPEPLHLARSTRPPTALDRDFAESVYRLLKAGHRQSWRAALETLESDPNFHEAEVSHLSISGLKPRDAEEEAVLLWRALSTGHKIVLLTITRLVETVTERSLILIDEPEGHLHPPLLAAFVRALSDLLKSRNGVAVVASHSPVVLQEVPRECAWKVRRVGLSQIAERPTIETFGESIGILTSEVFSLEVTDSGYHKMLAEASMQLGSYEAVIDAFNGELGFEARALVRSFFASQRA